MSTQKRRSLKRAARYSDVRLDDPNGISPNEHRDLIQETLEDLEHKGLIYNTGCRRNGQIVYAATPTLKERN